MSFDAYAKLAEVPDNSTVAEKAMAWLWAECCYYVAQGCVPADQEQKISDAIGQFSSTLQYGQDPKFDLAVYTAHKLFLDTYETSIVTELTPQFLEVLNQHNLMRLISMEALKDEYSPEVLPIIVWLMLHPECPLNELRAAIKKVFVMFFDSSAVCIDTEHYNKYDTVTQDLAVVWSKWLDQQEQNKLWEGADDHDDVFDYEEHRRVNHSRDAFEYLVQHYPEKLLSWIREEQLRPEDLTFAADLAGSIPVELGSQDVLVSLLQHPEALVREGAVLGLWRQAPLPENILVMLHGLAAHDSSNAVKKTVFDVLEYHEDQKVDKPLINERQK